MNIREEHALRLFFSAFDLSVVQLESGWPEASQHGPAFFAKMKGPGSSESARHEPFNHSRIMRVFKRRGEDG
jgi:hypothetical protein